MDPEQLIASQRRRCPLCEFVIKGGFIIDWTVLSRHKGYGTLTFVTVLQQAPLQPHTKTRGDTAVRDQWAARQELVTVSTRMSGDELSPCRCVSLSIRKDGMRTDDFVRDLINKRDRPQPFPNPFKFPSCRAVI